MRKLADEERALWAKVIATVKPLHRVAVPVVQGPHKERSRPSPQQARPRTASLRAGTPPPASANTLDGSWDRRLSRGLVRPDVTIDLHGHSLAAAHALLDRRLEAAIGAGDRLVLLVTGRPPAGDERPARRGAIRAAVGDWLAASRHGPEIAAIRAAHARHGGAGALYIILRNRHRGQWQNS
jgi:DNA-nicking Smr family endonuclease